MFQMVDRAFLDRQKEGKGFYQKAQFIRRHVFNMPGILKV